jgi:hypothetical protein
MDDAVDHTIPLANCVSLLCTYCSRQVSQVASVLSLPQPVSKYWMHPYLAPATLKVLEDGKDTYLVRELHARPLPRSFNYPENRYWVKCVLQYYSTNMTEYKVQYFLRTQIKCIISMPLVRRNAVGGGGGAARRGIDLKVACHLFYLREGGARLQYCKYLEHQVSSEHTAQLSSAITHY